jgi:hypothetical protein
MALRNFLCGAAPYFYVALTRPNLAADAVFLIRASVNTQAHAGGRVASTIFGDSYTIG